LVSKRYSHWPKRQRQAAPTAVQLRGAGAWEALVLAEALVDTAGRDVAAGYHVSQAAWAIHVCNVWRHQFI